MDRGTGVLYRACPRQSQFEFGGRGCGDRLAGRWQPFSRDFCFNINPKLNLAVASSAGLLFFCFAGVSGSLPPRTPCRKRYHQAVKSRWKMHCVQADAAAVLGAGIFVIGTYLWRLRPAVPGLFLLPVPDVTGRKRHVWLSQLLPCFRGGGACSCAPWLVNRLGAEEWPDFCGNGDGDAYGGFGAG